MTRKEFLKKAKLLSNSLALLKTESQGLELLFCDLKSSEVVRYEKVVDELEPLLTRLTNLRLEVHRRIADNARVKREERERERRQPTLQ
jgi:hypothetical protein